jgi:hypothetical protein
MHHKNLSQPWQAVERQDLVFAKSQMVFLSLNKGGVVVFEQ